MCDVIFNWQSSLILNYMQCRNQSNHSHKYGPWRLWRLNSKLSFTSLKLNEWDHIVLIINWFQSIKNILSFLAKLFKKAEITSSETCYSSLKCSFKITLTVFDPCSKSNGRVFWKLFAINFAIKSCTFFSAKSVFRFYSENELSEEYQIANNEWAV